MPRILIPILLGFFLSAYSYGQCSPSVFYKDNDTDGAGTNNFDTTDISKAVTDFNDARTGNTVYYGNIAYGCSKQDGYATIPGDCNDKDRNATRNATWFIDSDNDGAYGTRQSGCGYPSGDYSGNIPNSDIS